MSKRIEKRCMCNKFCHYNNSGLGVWELSMVTGDNFYIYGRKYINDFIIIITARFVKEFQGV